MVWACLKHKHREPAARQHISHSTAACTAPDDKNVKLGEGGIANR
jgi:hypothetical protein